MLPTSHAIISGILGYGIYKCSGSAPAGCAAFLSGILIDFDHHIDYLIAKGRIPLSYKKLFYFCSYDSYPKIYLLFHAWEYLALLWFFIYIAKLHVIWIGFALGLTTHMICDQWVNPLKPLGYFLIYRIKQGFLKRKILTDEYFSQQIR